jgi:hypothetical protein
LSVANWRKLIIKIKGGNVNLDLVTKSDLLELKSDLIEEIKKIIPIKIVEPDEYLKSSEVRRLMKISAGTLLHLRISGKLPFIKIGRIVYFRREDIRRMLSNGTPEKSVVKRLLTREVYGDSK